MKPSLVTSAATWFLRIRLHGYGEPASPLTPPFLCLQWQRASLPSFRRARPAGLVAAGHAALRFGSGRHGGSRFGRRRQRLLQRRRRPVQRGQLRTAGDRCVQAGWRVARCSRANPDRVRLLVVRPACGAGPAGAGHRPRQRHRRAAQKLGADMAVCAARRAFTARAFIGLSRFGPCAD